MISVKLVTQRVMLLELLKDFYQRSVKERRMEETRKVFIARRDLLRAMREKRGFES